MRDGTRSVYPRASAATCDGRSRAAVDSVRGCRSSGSGQPRGTRRHCGHGAARSVWRPTRSRGAACPAIAARTCAAGVDRAVDNRRQPAAVDRRGHGGRTGHRPGRRALRVHHPAPGGSAGGRRAAPTRTAGSGAPLDGDRGLDSDHGQRPVGPDQRLPARERRLRPGHDPAGAVGDRCDRVGSPGGWPADPAPAPGAPGPAAVARQTAANARALTAQSNPPNGP
jgi:hypothetical protein